MTINDYKATLKNIIDNMNDELVLQRWKTLLETEFEQYRQGNPEESQRVTATGSAVGDTTDKEDNAGYVVIESGLGIDE